MVDRNARQRHWLTSAVLFAAPPSAETFTLPIPRGPAAPPAKTNGLTIAINATACVGVGYAPIVVTVSTTAASPANRAFKVRIGPCAAGYIQPHLAVAGDLELPAGATSTTTVLRVPLLVVAQALQFDFWEDGQHLPDLSSRVVLTGWQSGTGARRTQYFDYNSAPTVLWPASGGLKLPDVEHWQNTLVLNRAANNAYAPCDLPELAIDYSQWDAVLISIDELTHVTAARSSSWRAHAAVDRRRWQPVDLRPRRPLPAAR